MSELVTTGTWIVKPGEEEAFVEDWARFAEWASTLRGATALRLGRDRVDTSKFISFAPWADEVSVRAWKSQPEFPERLSRVKAHTTSFRSFELDVVAVVASTAAARV